MTKKGAKTVSCDKCGYTASTSNKTNMAGKTCTYCHKGTFKEVK